MGANVVEVDESTWGAEVINSELPVLVDFWAAWCGPCRMVAPIMEELSIEYDGKMKFTKLNVDDNQNVAGQYQVMSIPTFAIFLKGEVVKRFVGAMPKDRFLLELKDWLE